MPGMKHTLNNIIDQIVRIAYGWYRIE